MSDIKAVLRQRISDALTAPVPALTRRDVRLPKVKGKAQAVIGMRRSGKSTFLWQCLGAALAATPSAIHGRRSVQRAEVLGYDAVAGLARMRQSVQGVNVFRAGGQRRDGQPSVTTRQSARRRLDARLQIRGVFSRTRVEGDFPP